MAFQLSVDVIVVVLAGVVSFQSETSVDGMDAMDGMDVMDGMDATVATVHGFEI